VRAPAPGCKQTEGGHHATVQGLAALRTCGGCESLTPTAGTKSPDTLECADGSITRSITRRSFTDPTPDRSASSVPGMPPHADDVLSAGRRVVGTAAGRPGCDQLGRCGTDGYRLPAEVSFRPPTASSTATPRTANRGRRGISTRRPNRTTGSSPFSMARVTVRTSTPNTEAACAMVTTAEPLALRSSRFTAIPPNQR